MSFAIFHFTFEALGAVLVIIAVEAVLFTVTEFGFQREDTVGKPLFIDTVANIVFQVGFMFKLAVWLPFPFNLENGGAGIVELCFALFLPVSKYSRW